MKMRSFEHDTVKGIVERIAETKVNNRPFDLDSFRTALKAVEDQCWDRDVIVKYEEMSIGVMFNYSCGLIVKGYFKEGDHKRGFYIFYEQSTSIMRFFKDLYR